jgi:hypothetical protein
MPQIKLQTLSLFKKDDIKYFEPEMQVAQIQGVGVYRGNGEIQTPKYVNINGVDHFVIDDRLAEALTTKEIYALSLLKRTPSVRDLESGNTVFQATVLGIAVAGILGSMILDSGKRAGKIPTRREMVGLGATSLAVGGAAGVGTNNYLHTIDYTAEERKVMEALEVSEEFRKLLQSAEMKTSQVIDRQKSENASGKEENYIYR